MSLSGWRNGAGIVSLLSAISGNPTGEYDAADTFALEQEQLEQKRQQENEDRERQRRDEERRGQEGSGW